MGNTPTPPSEPTNDSSDKFLCIGNCCKTNHTCLATHFVDSYHKFKTAENDYNNLVNNNNQYRSLITPLE